MSWGEQKRLNLLMSSVSSAFSYSDSETTAETELHGQPAMEIDWSKLIKMLRNAKAVSKIFLFFYVYCDQAGKVCFYCKCACGLKSSMYTCLDCGLKPVCISSKKYHVYTVNNPWQPVLFC